MGDFKGDSTAFISASLPSLLKTSLRLSFVDAVVVVVVVVVVPTGVEFGWSVLLTVGTVAAAEVGAVRAVG